MTDFLYYVGYWTIVFAGSSWFVHETWPFGLAMIPLAATNIYLQKRLNMRMAADE